MEVVRAGEFFWKPIVVGDEVCELRTDAVDQDRFICMIRNNICNKRHKIL